MSHEGSVIPPRRAAGGLLALLAFLLSALVAIAPAAGQLPPPHIVFVGDSLTAGLGVGPGKGYPERLAALLAQEGLDIRVTNAGVSGDTSAGGLSRLDWSVPEDTDGVVLALGANDALRGIPVAETRANLAAIIERLKARGIAVYLAGMVSPPNMGAAYAAEFDPLYHDLAQRYDVPLYPFLLDGVAAAGDLNQADGMHPNEAGMAVIAKAMLPSMRDFVARVMGE
ncbi:MAG: arylesterase [Nitratireductor sp.]|nr:arylesterase [Nitratireductor sp.]